MWSLPTCPRHSNLPHPCWLSLPDHRNRFIVMFISGAPRIFRYNDVTFRLQRNLSFSWTRSTSRCTLLPATSFAEPIRANVHCFSCWQHISHACNIPLLSPLTLLASPVSELLVAACSGRPAGRSHRTAHDRFNNSIDTMSKSVSKCYSRRPRPNKPSRAVVLRT